MKTVFDRETKRYLVLFAALATGLLFVLILILNQQSAALKAALRENDVLAASALLSKGVSVETAAQALVNTEATEAGRALVDGIGLSEAAALRYYPAAGALGAGAPALLAAAFTLLIAEAAATLAFLRRRERLYGDCARILGRFEDGDFSKRLPRAREGGLYAMLASADALAMTLESRSEGEKQAKEGLRDVISDVSHQLKTPLAALRLYVELMDDRAEEPETVRGFTEKATLSIDRIEGLIQTLLKVMRLDTGNVEFHKERCRVSDIAANAVTELLTRAKVEGKKLTLEGDGDVVLNCDPQWTAEALMNLVKNALDYTETGGNICVSWEQTPGMVRIAVSDDGRGISPDDMPFLFKRFYRGSHSRDIQGVGLGLPLTKSVVEAQGGMLSVKSQQGGGTRFIASFLTAL